MAEADLILAKAFLLFAVAGYTTTVLSADPQSERALQTLAHMATSFTSDRATDAPHSDWARHGEPLTLSDAGFPLHLGQQTAVFSEFSDLQRSGPQHTAYSEQSPLLSTVLSASSLNLSQPVDEGDAVKLHQRSASALTLPPVLTDAGFQFQL